MCQQLVIDGWSENAQRTCLRYVASMRSRCQAVHCEVRGFDAQSLPCRRPLSEWRSCQVSSPMYCCNDCVSKCYT